MHIRQLLVIILLSFSVNAYSQQQDVEFHLSREFLQGKKVLKVKRDFNDPYLWVLAKNNEVYRINSITLTVDNYTSNFSAYNNLQFIDIAGRGQDTVFIATRSANVIQYRNGNIDLIGSAIIGNDTVTSVGVDYAGRIDNNIYPTFGHVLLIGTVKGMYRYDMDKGTANPGSDQVYSQVFEATYRRDLYSGFMMYDFGDTVAYHPVQFTNPYTIFTQYVWLNGSTFGNKLNTAFYVPYGFNNVSYAYGTNLFWGTEKGLSQVNRNYNDQSSWPHAHYLNNIPVNKITDIFGLTAFGSDGIFADPGLIKQTLLVGTDQGLYFSSSIFNKFDQVNGFGNGLRAFALFHYDELGNIRVNDICTNLLSDNPLICENGVWVACDNGLYLLKPDYAKYINSQQLHAAGFENLPDSVSSTEICSGTSTTAILNTSLYSGSSIQWYKNGIELPGESQRSLVIGSAGDYYAVLYDPCENIHLESNHLKVQVISAPVFNFNYPARLPLCNSTSTVLKTDNNPQYSYRWYTNGVLNGATDYQYTVTQSGRYKVEVSACTNSWVPSNEIEVDLINLPDPAVTADKSNYCAGDIATLTVNTPVDPGYHINWYQDGNLLTADLDKISIPVTTDGNYTVTLSSTVGPCTQTSAPQPIAFTPAPAFTFNYPAGLRYCSGTPVTLKAEGSAAYQYRWYKDGTLTGDIGPALTITQTGEYKVEVSSCEGSWVPSKTVQVDLINIPVPVITTDKSAYCIGDNATLSIGAPIDPGYTINWYRDNVLLNAAVNTTKINTDIAGTYSVTIVNNQPNTDGSICSQTANPKSISFDQLPTISIQKIVKTTLCDGQTVDLKVTYNTGTVKWSTGQNNDQITVRNSGTYTASVTTAAGCSVAQAIDVTFFPNPILNIPNAGVCVPSHKTATLTAPQDLVSYTWNGQSGTNTYTVDHPQTVTLTVTDANGCQATQQIQINDECPDVRIPNAFTPNGDGINDTWDIIGLEYDPTAMVRIFTRYGQQVFQSKGYGTAWNGEYQGKKLPVGAYYYIINTKNGTQTYSGEVTIIY
jgi:gliding motility-associated-like protein